MSNSVALTTTKNSVSVTGLTTLVEPLTTDVTVVVAGSPTTITVNDTKVNLSVAETIVAVTVQSDTISVISAATQGPQGPVGSQGPVGTTGPQGPTSGDEFSVLNKAERNDTVEDAPATGDITIYYGIAAPQSLETAAVWLITKFVYLKDGGAFDGSKTFASITEDMKWSDHLIHTYT